MSEKKFYSRLYNYLKRPESVNISEFTDEDRLLGFVDGEPRPVSASKIEGEVSRAKGEINVNASPYNADKKSDATQVIQDALDDAESTDKRLIIPPGEYNIYDSGLVTSCNYINMMPGAELIYHGTGYGLTIQDVKKGDYNLRINRINDDWDSETGTGNDNSSVGLRLLNHENSRFYIREVRRFYQGVICEGNDDAFANNILYLGEIRENQRQIETVEEGSGFANQNIVVGGQLRISSNHTAQLSGSRGAVITGGAWQFFGTNFEGTQVEKALEVSGSENLFYGCRFEGIVDDGIHFTSNSGHNVLFYPRNMRDPDDSKLLDEGNKNIIIAHHGQRLWGSSTTINDIALQIHSEGICFAAGDESQGENYFEVDHEGKAYFYDIPRGSDPAIWVIDPVTRTFNCGNTAADPDILFRADGAGEAELRGELRADVNGFFSQAPRNMLTAISSPKEGDMGYHDGTGGNTVGPCFYNGSNWISLVDGTTIS